MRCTRCPANLGSGSDSSHSPAKTQSLQLEVSEKPAWCLLVWVHCRSAKADRRAPFSTAPQELLSLPLNSWKMGCTKVP
eukprot:1757445-Heterocapsa_arctica.AAC.2